MLDIRLTLTSYCRVKFGAFYEFLVANHGHEFDRVASGHYARILRNPVAGDPVTVGSEQPVCPEQPVRLALTPDAVKDQTYFLAHLTQQQLSRVLFSTWRTY